MTTIFLIGLLAVVCVILYVTWPAKKQPFFHTAPGQDPLPYLGQVEVSKYVPEDLDVQPGGVAYHNSVNDYLNTLPEDEDIDASKVSLPVPLTKEEIKAQRHREHSLKYYYKNREKCIAKAREYYRAKHPLSDADAPAPGPVAASQEAPVLTIAAAPKTIADYQAIHDANQVAAPADDAQLAADVAKRQKHAEAQRRYWAKKTGRPYEQPQQKYTKRNLGVPKALNNGRDYQRAYYEQARATGNNEKTFSNVLPAPIPTAPTYEQPQSLAFGYAN